VWPSLSLESPSRESGLFGGALAGVGDLDADGYGDLLVAALGEELEPGRAYLFPGGRQGPSAAPSQELSGAGEFGRALAGLGDLNGDGFADLGIGAYLGGEGAGAVHLFYGSPEGLGEEPDLLLAGPDGSGSHFGYALASGGDLNGDGYADLVVGAPNAEGARGQVFVYLGSSEGPDPLPETTLVGLNAGGGYFGYAVSGFGDGNGDGYADLAVGAFGVDGRRGRVLAYLGGPAGLVVPEEARIEGHFGGEGDFGWSLAPAGDADGDLLGDLVVGAPGVDDRQGRAYVHRGSVAALSSIPLQTLVGASGGSFGRALARADR
jgi:hypothetical protein